MPFIIFLALLFSAIVSAQVATITDYWTKSTTVPVAAEKHVLVERQIGSLLSNAQSVFSSIGSIVESGVASITSNAPSAASLLGYPDSLTDEYRLMLYLFRLLSRISSDVSPILSSVASSRSSTSAASAIATISKSAGYINYVTQVGFIAALILILMV